MMSNSYQIIFNHWDSLLVMALLLSINIQVFTTNSHTNATSISSQPFCPICPTQTTIQIHLDTQDLHLMNLMDPKSGLLLLNPETGIPVVERITTRQPHFKALTKSVPTNAPPLFTDPKETMKRLCNVPLNNPVGLDEIDNFHKGDFFGSGSDYYCYETISDFRG
ncbi:hypothetical protein BC830DRAFT_855899 [Chytriomyces sp. MP71]|nr:hypothetical protein BC830DRAFT_855899 [Chytriomyces sp. MP71]